MADRKFDYAAVAESYKKMQNILGDASNADSIAGILDSIDKDVRNSVGICEESVFGDLGSQLLLDWDNTSSGFPGFVSNFENWSTLVAQASGNYAQFEQDITAMRTANPLGVSSNGITDAYTNTGFYRQYKNDNYDNFVSEASALRALNSVDLSNIEYAVTDSQAILARHKVVTGIMLAGDVVSTVLIAIGAVGTLGGAASTTTELAPVGSGGGYTMTAGGTPMLGGGQAVTLEQAAANCGGNQAAMAFIEQAKGMGAKAIVTNGTEFQLLDGSGKVLATIAQSGASTSASAAASAATGAATTSKFGSFMNAASNGVKSGASKVGNFFKGTGSKVAGGASNVASNAKTVASNAATATGGFIKRHPVATTLGATMATSAAVNNFQND